MKFEALVGSGAHVFIAESDLSLKTRPGLLVVQVVLNIDLASTSCRKSAMNKWLICTFDRSELTVLLWNKKNMHVARLNPLSRVVTTVAEL